VACQQRDGVAALTLRKGLQQVRRYAVNLAASAARPRKGTPSQSGRFAAS
jgi:hypothetical protein